MKKLNRDLSTTVNFVGRFNEIENLRKTLTALEISTNYFSLRFPEYIA